MKMTLKPSEHRGIRQHPHQRPTKQRMPANRKAFFGVSTLTDVVTCNAHTWCLYKYRYCLLNINHYVAVAVRADCGDWVFAKTLHHWHHPWCRTRHRTEMSHSLWRFCKSMKKPSCLYPSLTCSNIVLSLGLFVGWWRNCRHEWHADCSICFLSAVNNSCSLYNIAMIAEVEADIYNYCDTVPRLISLPEVG